MSFLQLSVVDNEAYQLLTDGTVLQLITGPNTHTWKVIDSNPDNVQIVANAPVGLRHVNGEVFQYKQSWRGFGTNATKLWGWKGSFWQWQKFSGTLWYEGPETHGKWEVRDKNPALKDLVRVQDDIYQLSEDGEIKRYQSPENWTVISDATDVTAIASDNKTLYKLHKNGYIFSFNGDQWDRIGGDKETVQLAAGDAGVFHRHRGGAIGRYLGNQRWTTIDNSRNNTYMAVARSVYRVNSIGEIYVLGDNGEWQLLPDPPLTSSPTQSGPQPQEVYNGGYDNATETLLCIGNGGAGQSGLLRVVGDAFIKHRVSQGADPFQVAWYKSDTTESINFLKNGVVDVAITYTPVAEEIAVKQGIAQAPPRYIFREHILLVGPPSNPAQLDPNADVVSQFIALYTAAEAGNTTPAVRFLSRFDKSATNIKDSELWVKIGQVPWATKYSDWYHQFLAYPIQALEAAAALEEYTLTDWGTYLSVDESIEQQLVIYKKGSDNGDDTLLLPAHLLVGNRAQDPTIAQAFADWITSEEGQAVITGFRKKGQQVYSRAPAA